MRKLIDSFLAFVRGGHSPTQVAAAVGLGLLAGFATGCNATLAALVLAAIAVNVATRTLCQCWAIGAGLGWLLTPVSFHAGYFILEKSPLADPFSRWSQSWLVAAFDADRFTLTGGLVVGGLLALPAAWLAARTVRLLTEQLRAAAAQDKSELDPPLRGLAAFVCWSVFGGVEAGIRTVGRRESAGRLRMLCVAVMLAAAAGVWHTHGPELLGRRLLSRIAAANDAQAEATSIQFFPNENRVVIHDLRLADPEHLDRDRLRVDYVQAAVESGALLRGKIRIDKLLLDNVQCDTPRDKRAVPQELGFHGLVSSPAHDPQVSQQSEPGLSLPAFAADWKSWEARSRKFRDLIARIEQLAPGDPVEKQDKRAGEADFAPLGYATMRDLRSGFQHEEPNFSVELLRASGLPSSWGLGDDAILEIARLSSDPALTGKPTLIVLSSPVQNAELNVQLDLHQASRRHAVRLRAHDIDLTKLLRSATAKRVITVRRGKLSLTGTGWITGERLELPLALHGENLSLEIAADQQPAGLAATTWNDGLRRLGRLDAVAVIEGNWKSPRLAVDSCRLTEDFKRGLSATGETELVRAIDRQLENQPHATSRSFAARHSESTDGQNEEETAIAGNSVPKTDYDLAITDETSAASEQAASRPSQGENWRPKGVGPASFSAGEHVEDDLHGPADRYDQSEVTADAVDDKPKVVQSARIDRPSPGRIVIRPTMGAELRYPESTLSASDRPAERKAAYEPKLVQELGIGATPRATKLVIEPTAHKPGSNGMATASDTGADDEAAASASTVALRRPADLGLELGYDTRKDKTSEQDSSDAKATASNSTSDDTPGDGALPTRKELPQALTSFGSRKSAKTIEIGGGRPNSGLISNDIEAGFNKFSTNVKQGFHKVLPANKPKNAAPAGPKDSWSKNFKKAFPSKHPQNSAAPTGKPAMAQSDDEAQQAATISANDSQAKAEKPWYKIWR